VQNKKNEAPTSGSLHDFFRPATEEQRWSSQRFSTKPPTEGITEEIEDTEDMIEDDDSFDEIFAPRITRKKTPVEGGRDGSQLSRRKPFGRCSSEGKQLGESINATKRFLIPTGPDFKKDRRHLSATSESLEETSPRPWADRYPPSNLDELAVHKRKVTDVQNWLTDVFAGTSRRVCVFSLVVLFSICLVYANST
jgi:cell cycle checkpoint protein